MSPVRMRCGWVSSRCATWATLWPARIAERRPYASMDDLVRRTGAPAAGGGGVGHGRGFRVLRPRPDGRRCGRRGRWCKGAPTACRAWSWAPTRRRSRPSPSRRWPPPTCGPPGSRPTATRCSSPAPASTRWARSPPPAWPASARDGGWWWRAWSPTASARPPPPGSSSSTWRTRPACSTSSATPGCGPPTAGWPRRRPPSSSGAASSGPKASPTSSPSRIEALSLSAEGTRSRDFR